MAPNPEVTAKAKRLCFMGEYKRRILREADVLSKTGGIGELLRHKGLYYSHRALVTGSASPGRKQKGLRSWTIAITLPSQRRAPHAQRRCPFGGSQRAGPRRPWLPLAKSLWPPRLL